MKSEKKTLLIGASLNAERMSNRVAKLLAQQEYETILIGNRDGSINENKIYTSLPDLKNIDTVTMYLAPEKQSQYYNYILSLQPKRIIFNPGAENPELARLAVENGIEVINVCTMVMLTIGNY